MRTTIRTTLLLLLLCAILGLSATGCSLWPQSFKSPVEKFLIEPTTAGDLAKQLGQRHPPIKHMRAKLKVRLSGGPLPGSHGLTLYTLYVSPDRILLKADESGMVEVFRVIQNKDMAAVSLAQASPGPRFYRGPLSELDAHPEALFGVRPIDITRTLLACQEVVALLKSVPEETNLPEPAPGSPHWVFSTDSAQNRREFYFVRREDGLVEKIAVYDARNMPRLLVTFKRYEMFDDVVVPSRFELSFAGTNLRMLVEEVEQFDLMRPLDEVFSTEPPPGSGIVAESLGDWFAREDLASRQ